MRLTRCLISVAVLTAAGCGSSPTAPPPTPVIAVSQSTLSLERTATMQVTATSTVSNATTDITASGAWRSSNEQVARVAAGLVTAAGPGTATITVEQAGASQTVAVTVRRRVYVTGDLTVTDRHGEPGGIASVVVLLDSREYGGRGFSSPVASATAPFGTVSYRFSIAPGTHRFDLHIPTKPGDAYSEYPFMIVFDQAVNPILGPPRVVDLDTGETVGTFNLENRNETFPNNPTITWTFTLSAFTL